MYFFVQDLITLTNSKDSDEMPLHLVFHLGFNCLVRYPLRGFLYTKGYFHLLYFRISVISVMSATKILHVHVHPAPTRDQPVHFPSRIIVKDTFP